MKSEVTFSTGDVAKFCNATIASVNNWIKAKKIKVYHTPGGQYRILLEDLIDFMKKNNMHLPDQLLKYLGKKVLIIDDDEDIVKLLSTMITEADSKCEIDSTDNGIDGLIKVGNFKPDLIFLDLLLPKMDGIEVCNKIKNNPLTRDTRIAIISSYIEDDEFKGKIKQIKADEIIPKPISKDSILKVIESI